ncbi:MAG: hypothetical protein HY721_22210 [Planctomycetes bacterium]|nr:hypothetical protein [Planctomycetota bacterium]
MGKDIDARDPAAGASRARRLRDGRLSVALLGAGPFVVVALEQWGKHLWLAVFLFALGAAGPVAYIASEAYLAARRGRAGQG